MYWPYSYLHQGSLCSFNTQERDQVSIGRKAAHQGKLSEGPRGLAIMCSTDLHGSRYSTIPALLKPLWSQILCWDGWPAQTWSLHYSPAALQS